MTGRAARLERQPIRTGVERKKAQKEERCAIEWQFVVNYSEIENDVLVDFLSLDCSLRHIETTPGQLFSLLSLPPVCSARFYTDIFAWLGSGLQFSEPLIWPPPHFPASACSQFVSKLTASCRHPHSSDPRGCFQNSVAVAFSHVSLKGVCGISGFLETNLL